MGGEGGGKFCKCAKINNQYRKFLKISRNLLKISGATERLPPGEIILFSPPPPCN